MDNLTFKYCFQSL